MLFNNNNSQSSVLSPVAQMFNGRSVFITGASGFIGRVLLEKLLRSYQGIKRVYILLRPKRNVLPQDRLHRQLLRVPIFDKIRSMKNAEEIVSKIFIVPGDIGEPGLGISDGDLQMLLDDESLSIVYHSAATVKFDEPLRSSVRLNLVATKSMIDFCKRLPNLICLCHVSTAYVNSNIKDDSIIEEKLYPMNQTPDDLIKLANIMDEEMLQQIKPKLVGDRPNTYTYTKALAEHLIALEASNLPVAIVRPSIVVAAWKEPLPGWVDNLNGPTGLILAIGKGLLRSMHVKRECKADLIPVDVVVNTMIAAGYYAAKTGKTLQVEQPVANGCSLIENNQTNTILGGLDADKLVLSEKVDDEDESMDVKQRVSGFDHKKTPPIFHCTSGSVNPISWGQMEDTFFSIIRKYPSQQVLRYPFGSFKSNKLHDTITRLFVHYLPALIIDLICLVMGKKRQLLSIYFKLHCAVEALSNFSTQNYNFSASKLKLLEQCLSDETDKRELYMNIGSLNWFSFWDDYVLGAR